MSHDLFPATPDARATAPIPCQEPHMSVYSRSLCVAPSAVFPDYDRVMASLQSEREEFVCIEEVLDAKTKDSLPPDLEQNNSGTYELSCEGPDFEINFQVTAEVHGSGDNEEYQDKTRNVHAHAGLDISNTYAGCIRKPSHSQFSKPKASKRRRAVLVSLEDTGVSLRARCPYVNPKDGTRCRKVNKTLQDAGRHWRSCHLYKEAKEMLTGTLAVGKGTAITSEAQLGEVKPHVQCQFCSALITRSDAMQRHLRTNCKAAEHREENQYSNPRGTGCRGSRGT